MFVFAATDFNLTVFFELLFGLAESLRTMRLREDDLAIFSALLLLASGMKHFIHGTGPSEASWACLRSIPRHLRIVSLIMS